MKKVRSAIFALALTALLASGASAVSLQVAETRLTEQVALYQSTTYAPLRAVSTVLDPNAKVSWENGIARVQTPSLSLTARPGDSFFEANGRMLYAADGVKLINGTTLVPVRALAKAFGASVDWDNRARKAIVTRGSGTIGSGDSFYNGDDLYWLSRIIQAESSGESLAGKIAVGNVIQNRVASSQFPNSIYEVIFDSKFGVQFTPTSNGMIYKEPSAESILAAKLCLDGASVAGSSLYFLNPAKATSFWITENRPYICTIGGHSFYA